MEADGGEVIAKPKKEPRYSHYKTYGSDIVRPELIYNMDFEEIVGLMKKVRTDKTYGKQSHDFYHACLERLNSLTLERNSQVRKPQML